MEKSTPQPEKLTETQVREASDEDYMDAAQLEFFRRLLIELHDSTRQRIQSAKDQMSNPIDLSDESDRASWEEQCSISMRIVDREQRLLPKIQQALERIRLGDYGYCLESGEPIGIPRLLARPTAEYCAEVKSVREIREHAYKD